MGTDHKLVRSKTNEGALINTDIDALHAYKKRKRQAQRVDELEKDVSEIKLMLTQLLDKFK